MADGVERIRLHLPDGSFEDAMLGRNVFAWAARADGQLPVAIDVVLHDGTVVRQQFDHGRLRDGTLRGDEPPVAPYVVSSW